MNKKGDNSLKVSASLLLFQSLYMILLVSGKSYDIFSPGNSTLRTLEFVIAVIVFIVIPLIQIWFFYKFVKSKILKLVLVPVLSWLILLFYILYIILLFKTNPLF